MAPPWWSDVGPPIYTSWNAGLTLDPGMAVHTCHSSCDWGGRSRSQEDQYVASLVVGNLPCMKEAPGSVHSMAYARQEVQSCRLGDVRSSKSSSLTQWIPGQSGSLKILCKIETENKWTATTETPVLHHTQILPSKYIHVDNCKCGFSKALIEWRELLDDEEGHKSRKPTGFF